MRWISLVVPLVCFLFASCGGEEAPADEPRSDSITGTVSILFDPTPSDLPGFRYEFEVGTPCTGASISRGFSDIAPGAPVTVKNEEGTIIATGSVSGGSWTENSCRLDFSIDDVPEAKFYQVEVGRRGELRYSAEQLEAMGRHVELSVGG